MDPTSARRVLLQRAPLVVGFALFLFVFFKNAWVTDDAYIIFRSIEQLFAGNGPVWNPGERVQAFTSPLWFFVLSIPRVVSADVFLNAIVVSAILCVAALGFVRMALRDSATFLVAVLFFASSNAFFDFTSSGLENPLAYGLIAAYLYFYSRLFSTAPDTRRLVPATFVLFGLVILTRHDLSLLLLPSAAYVFVAKRGALDLGGWMRVVLIAFAPFVAWSLFAWIYYGTIFPNSALAKLNTGIDRADLVVQGFRYLGASFRYDLFTPLLIVAALAVSFVAGAKHTKWLAAGVLLSIVYVVLVGGDFMQGRFLSCGYLVSVVVLLWSGTRVLSGSRGLAVTALVVLAYAILYPHTPVGSPARYADRNDFYGVTDERGCYFPMSSIYRYAAYKSETPQARPVYFPVYRYSEEGYEFSRDERRVIRGGAIGFFGYWAGTDKTIVDHNALADPLLSRLPVRNKKKWRVGHFQRLIPEGYFESIESGTPQLADPQLNEFYKKVRIITHNEPLLSRRRVATIVNMGLGRYDHYIAHLRDRG